MFASNCGFNRVDATHWAKRSAGVSKLSVSLGRSFSRRATALSHGKELSKARAPEACACSSARWHRETFERHARDLLALLRPLPTMP